MEKMFKKSELVNQGFNAMSLSRRVKKQELGNLGFGFYIANPKNLKFENDELMQQINRLLDGYPFPPKRVVFSSKSLNFCINQLISASTYLVEVEKEYLQSVFETLKNTVGNVVLFKPSQEEKLNYWKPNAIYVTELYKRSPVNKDGSIAIEKLIFDLLFDEDIYSLYSGSDIEMAIHILCTEYCINYKTLFSYATRKSRKSELLERIENMIPSEILEVLSRDK